MKDVYDIAMIVFLIFWALLTLAILITHQNVLILVAMVAIAFIIVRIYVNYFNKE